MERRVVITGMGAVTPVGNDAACMWENVCEGTLGFSEITLFDTSSHKVKIAAEVKGFNPEDFMEKREAKRLDRFSQFAQVAAAEAVKQSALDMEKVDRDRFGVIVGSGVGGFKTMELEYGKLLTQGPARISPFFVPMMISNMASGNIAIAYGLRGPCLDTVTACATGTNCIGDAYRMIKHGYTDTMLAGGAEAAITPMGIAAFANMTALSTTSDVKSCSIPFDARRNGFVLGEGAGVVVLEAMENAIKRGATILAEVVGYGVTGDGYHITAPSPDGSGAMRAMLAAIDEAGITADEISYINAHGTSTPPNDKVETLAIKRAFGDAAYRIPVSSTKSVMGHLLGAAGAVEAVIAVKAILDGVLPPTMGYSEKDPECDLDYVPNVMRKADVKYALSNSLGFGGHNATLLLKRFEN